MLKRFTLFRSDAFHGQVDTIALINFFFTLTTTFMPTETTSSTFSTRRFFQLAYVHHAFLAGQYFYEGTDWNYAGDFAQIYNTGLNALYQIEDPGLGCFAALGVDQNR